MVLTISRAAAILALAIGCGCSGERSAGVPSSEATRMADRTGTVVALPGEKDQRLYLCTKISDLRPDQDAKDALPAPADPAVVPFWPADDKVRQAFATVQPGDGVQFDLAVNWNQAIAVSIVSIRRMEQPDRAKLPGCQ
jgi:hypothetical protein